MIIFFCLIFNSYLLISKHDVFASIGRFRCPGISTLHLIMHTSDLTHLYCWVCSDETDLSAALDADREAFRTLQSSRRRFIHACKCSLIAHENVGLLELTPVPPIMDSPASQHAS